MGDKGLVDDLALLVGRFEEAVRELGLVVDRMSDIPHVIDDATKRMSSAASGMQNAAGMIDLASRRIG